MVTKRKRSSRVPVAAYTLAKLLRALCDTGGTSPELAELVGLHPKTVANYLKVFRKERLIYVSGYSVDKLGRCHWRSKIWAWGKRPDAPFPRMSPEAIRQRKRHAARSRALMARQLNLLRVPEPQTADA